jgi:transposase
MEGQNIAFEHRSAHDQPELFPKLALELASLNVDVIFARGTWALAAAKNATRAIPIAGIDLEINPVEAGLVASIARPGGNITGMFLDLSELSGKHLQFLKEIIPGTSRVAVLANPDINASQLRQLNRVAGSLSVDIRAVDVKSATDLDGAFDAAKNWHADALIVLSNPLSLAYRTRIGYLAEKAGLPTIYLYRAHVDAGGLISYGPDLADMFRRCGGYVGRILRHQACRPPHRAPSEVRAGREPQDRESPRDYHSGNNPGARRRGDRVMGWMAPLRHLSAKVLVDRKPPANREPSMNEITTVGLDLAKHVFQVHGVDAEGTTVLRKQLRRGQVLAFFSRLPRCLVGMEACATAHYWARELRALGHEVRLMPAQYVKAYVKRNKNDAADAEAICEAVGRPTMRFVPVKTAEQQAAVLLHRGRERLVRQRTMLVNALRAHLAEFGVIAPQGLRNVGRLIAIIRDDDDARLPGLARQVLQVLAVQIEQLEAAIAALEKRLMGWHKSNPVSQRLATVPGIGPIIATAIAAMVAEPSGFRSGREFAAWLGLVPRQNSTGGKNRLGGISKRGNQYLRRLLINGASANLLRSKATNADPWVIGLRRRRPSLVVAVALANKTARIAWAVMHRQENYQRMATAA